MDPVTLFLLCLFLVMVAGCASGFLGCWSWVCWRADQRVLVLRQQGRFAEADAVAAFLDRP